MRGQCVRGEITLLSRALLGSELHHAKTLQTPKLRGNPSVPLCLMGITLIVSGRGHCTLLFHWVGAAKAGSTTPPRKSINRTIACHGSCGAYREAGSKMPTACLANRGLLLLLLLLSVGVERQWERLLRRRQVEAAGWLQGGRQQMHRILLSQRLRAGTRRNQSHTRRLMSTTLGYALGLIQGHVKLLRVKVVFI